MNCEKTQALLDGYFDGELDLVNGVEIEQHLQICSGCAAEHAGRQAVRKAIRGGFLYHRAPPRLHRQLDLTVQAISRPARTFSTRRVWGVLAAGLLVAAVLLAGLFFKRPATLPEQPNLAQSVIESHVRSLMAAHLVDVASSSRHTVKPWFSGKLDFAPPVADLAAQGFPLVGGRLDYLDNHPVAALVYKRQKHFINLFVWPAARDARLDGEEKTRQGYALLHWTQSGMTYWAVSDLNPGDLRQFARLVQSASRSAAPTEKNTGAPS